MIKLTNKHTRKPVYINQEHITCLNIGGSERGTFVHLSEYTRKESEEVIETREQIIELISQHRKEKK